METSISSSKMIGRVSIFECILSSRSSNEIVTRCGVDNTRVVKVGSGMSLLPRNSHLHEDSLDFFRAFVFTPVHADNCSLNKLGLSSAYLSDPMPFAAQRTCDTFFLHDGNYTVCTRSLRLNDNLRRYQYSIDTFQVSLKTYFNEKVIVKIKLQYKYNF